MRVGDRAWSAQYHVELEDNTITAWGCVPEYAAALEKTHGAGALQRMADEAKPLMPTFKECARRLYQDFMKAASAMAVASSEHTRHRTNVTPALSRVIVEPLVRRGSRRYA